MRISPITHGPETRLTGAPEAQPGEADRPSLSRRRAVTSMEYAVIISFILLVVIAGIQTLGFSVAGLFTSDAAATSKASATSNPPAPPP